MIKCRHIFFLAICICWQTLSANPLEIAGFRLNNNAKSVRIPIEIQHNVILIPVRINNSFEMRFILDTGVKTSILTEPVMAHFLALDSMAKIKVKGLGDGDPIEADLARNVRMTLPGI